MTIDAGTPRLVLPVGPRDHVQGPPEAPVTLVEYGDYECPYCGEAFPIVNELRRRMGVRLRFVFRNFPLSNMHPHATLAAEAAESAGAQHRFWEMHDALFEHQDALEEPYLVGYARRLGLDERRFATDLTGHLHAERVREDFMSGVRSGVNGTPTFYVNDVRHDGSYDIEELLEVLQHASPSGEVDSGSKTRKRAARRRSTE